MNNRQIANTLRDLGILPNYKGYKYLYELTELAMSGSISVGVLTKAGYPNLARKHQVTPMSIERACRTAIVRAYELYPDVYYNTLRIRSKPTNSEFIFALADTLAE